VKLVKLNVKVARNWWQDINVATGCCNLEWLHTFALSVYVNELPRLHAERWTVNALTVHENVAVNYHLACL
jgi:hypothetical protein